MGIVSTYEMQIKHSIFSNLIHLELIIKRINLHVKNTSHVHFQRLALIGFIISLI